MRRWRCSAALVLALAVVPEAPGADAAAPPRRPNVILIVTDDQGYGDLGATGNPTIRTPRLDALAGQSARFRSFCVSPVCSPTRASLLTGRYPYRTGVVDTFRGRSRMRPDEVTLAEALGHAGYRTGIFGKWHLGDNPPCRAMDQGFATSLVLRGGGLGQGFGPPGGDRYTDPTLIRDGREVRAEGYCTDIFADAAIRFVEAEPGRPFFACLAFNAPHDPLEVPDRFLEPYEALLGTTEDAAAAARVYAMLGSVDANVGRLLDRLDTLGLARDTIVAFLSDNGPARPRYNAGLLGLKQSVHEGGIRSPCFVRWPGRIDAGRVVDVPAAQVDLMPTLLAACGVGPPPGVELDGRDLLPWLEGRGGPWADRVVYFQWHRGDRPEFGRAFAARGGRFKLVQPLGVEPGPLPSPPRLELFDLEADPGERVDVAHRHPEVLAELLKGYRAWFEAMSHPRNFAVPPIQVGVEGDDPAILTRQDWRGEGTEWEPGSLGGWDVAVVRPGPYEMTVLHPEAGGGSIRFRLGGVEARAGAAPGSRSTALGRVDLPAGPGRMQAWVERPGGASAAYRLELRRAD